MELISVKMHNTIKHLNQYHKCASNVEEQIEALYNFMNSLGYYWLTDKTDKKYFVLLSPSKYAIEPPKAYKRIYPNMAVSLFNSGNWLFDECYGTAYNEDFSLSFAIESFQTAKIRSSKIPYLFLQWSKNKKKFVDRRAWIRNKKPNWFIRFLKWTIHDDK